jgi:flagellar basal-body rod protein FlgB
MSIDFKNAVGIHADALQLRNERTRVLAANIANENTPGFEARDMDFSSTLQQLQETSQPGEAGAMSAERNLMALDSEDGQNLYRVPFHPSRDGNTVEIGVEQAAFSQNASDFQTTLTFVNMKLRGLAKAINGQ